MRSMHHFFNHPLADGEGKEVGHLLQASALLVQKSDHVSSQQYLDLKLLNNFWELHQNSSGDGGESEGGTSLVETVLDRPTTGDPCGSP